MSLDVLVRLALPVIWLAVWSLACLGVGIPVVRRLSTTRDGGPELCLVLATGAAALSLTATILAFAGLFRPGVLGLVLAASSIAGVILIVRLPRAVAVPKLEVEPVSAFLVLATWGGLITVLSTSPVMFDVAHYHLAFPSRWLGAGGFVDFQRHGFSFYPAGHGMAYGYALATFGPWAASALHWWFGAVAALCAGTLASRFAGPRSGWWAMAVFALTPAALEISAFAMADLAVACWAGAAFVALLGKRDDTARPVLAGLMVGAAFSAKYLALATVALPVATAALLDGFVNRRHRWRMWMGLALGAAITAGPWMVKNLAATGNPVYPYFCSVLGGPDSGMNLGAELQQNELERAGAVGSAVQAASAPIYRTFRPLRQGGLFGLAWVFLLSAALFLRGIELRRWGPLAGAAVVGLLAWGSLVHFARFALPALVPAAALAGAAAAALASLPSTVLRRTFVGVLLVILAWNTTVIANQLNLDRLAVAVGLIEERRYLKTWLSYSPALDHVNHSLPEDAVVLLVAEPRSLYIERQVVVEDSYRLPLLLELSGEVSSAQELALKVAELGITHLLVNERHMEWSAHLRGADTFWQGGTPDSRRRVQEFFEHHVVKQFQDNGLWVGRLSVSSLP